MKNLATVDQALQEIKKGKMLILIDHPKRENEGDFYIPATKLTPKHLMMMVRVGGGLVCCAITQKRAHRLKLPLMVPQAENTEKTKVNFTISVNAKKGISTGVSAFDRVKTIKVLASPKSKPSDLLRPGHVLGLVASEGGILKRAGHTEAAVELSRLAGLTEAGVVCEILREDGKMAKLPDLIKLSKQLNIKILAIDDLIKYLNE